MSAFWIKVTGISGAAAVALGAIGAHAILKKDDYMKDTWRTANFYHFIHTCALGFTAFHFTGRKRVIVGSLLLTGIVLFSGSLYTIVIMNDRKPFASIAPYGGMSFIAAWIAFGFL